MTTAQLHEFARLGAEARLHAIAEEREAILRTFPQLRDGAAAGRRAPSPAPSPLREPRRGMSAAERKAVGERMRAYWANRRAEKAGESAPGSASAATATQPVKHKAMSPGRQAQAAKMRAYWAARRAEKQAGGRKRAGRKAGHKK
jgi:hypothetical protein